MLNIVIIGGVLIVSAMIGVGLADESSLEIRLETSLARATELLAQEDIGQSNAIASAHACQDTSTGADFADPLRDNSSSDPTAVVVNYNDQSETALHPCVPGTIVGSGQGSATVQPA